VEVSGVIRRGELNHHVEILEPTSTPASDGYGGRAAGTANVIAERLASIKQLSGNEAIAANQIRAGTTHEVRFDWVEELTTECTVRKTETGEVFEIVSKDDVNGEHVEHMLLCARSV